VTNDVKSQLKFLAELDSIEKKRKDEAEREKLMKAAKVNFNLKQKDFKIKNCVKIESI
jgi:hypothetical protein